MNHPSNGPALVSLGTGIGALALSIVAFWVGWVPVVSLINWIVVPLQGVASFAAIVSGIVGFRTAAALYGVGRGAAISGFLLGATGLALRVGLWLFGLV